MAVLLFKLALTPTLIGTLSVAGRRWGPSVSGWLVGLPLTSGPVALFLALGQGPSFAAQASIGILAGTFSAGIFCLAYSWLAFPCAWWLTLPASWLVFLVATLGLQQIPLPPPLPLFAAVVILLLLVLALLPRAVARRGMTTPPRWDIPARMLIATAFVLALTGSASELGPQLSGLLAPFPIYTTILAAFTHRLDGAAAVAQLMRGVVLGLFAFSAFFLIVALLLVPAGIAMAFVAAALVAFGIQATTLWLLRHAQRRHVALATAAEP